MRDNAFQFWASKHGQKSCRSTNNSVILIATGRECIWRRIIDNVKLRFGQAGCYSEILGDSVEVKEFFACRRSRATHRQYYLVRLPVRVKICCYCDKDGDIKYERVAVIP